MLMGLPVYSISTPRDVVDGDAPPIVVAMETAIERVSTRLNVRTSSERGVESSAAPDLAEGRRTVSTILPFATSFPQKPLSPKTSYYLVRRQRWLRPMADWGDVRHRPLAPPRALPTRGRRNWMAYLPSFFSQRNFVEHGKRK